jgi:EpsD family peptidyl-prolyl cis-trans isomerase
MRMPMRYPLTVLAVSLAFSLTACGDKADAPKADAQAVAAKVNDTPITQALLDHELAKLPNLSPEQAAQAANQVLRSLVDQELLAQQAVAEKLEDDAKVRLKLESARRQILAQAYADRFTADVPPPTDEEIADYYAKHPELFSERRLYALQEINVQAGPDNVERIKAALGQAKNLGEFVQWLKDNGIPARVGQSSKSAEQLPLELLPRLHQLKDGQALTFSAAGALNVVVVANSQTQPLSLEQARPVIERYLLNAKKRDKSAEQLKALKEKAKVEYLGAYAGAADAEPATPVTPGGAAGANGGLLDKPAAEQK